MTNEKRIFDLAERTEKFSENIIYLINKIPKDIITVPLISQLIRSGTSVGSNYCEADCAESRKDFEHKLSICKKEAKETKYWLTILTKAKPDITQTIIPLIKEANELQLIFIAIIKKSKSHGYVE